MTPRFALTGSRPGSDRWASGEPLPGREPGGVARGREGSGTKSPLARASAPGAPGGQLHPQHGHRGSGRSGPHRSPPAPPPGIGAQSPGVTTRRVSHTAGPCIAHGNAPRTRAPGTPPCITHGGPPKAARAGASGRAPPRPGDRIRRSGGRRAGFWGPGPPQPAPPPPRQGKSPWRAGDKNRHRAPPRRGTARIPSSRAPSRNRGPKPAAGRAPAREPPAAPQRGKGVRNSPPGGGGQAGTPRFALTGSRPGSDRWECAYAPRRGAAPFTAQLGLRCV